MKKASQVAVILLLGFGLGTCGKSSPSSDAAGKSRDAVRWEYATLQHTSLGIALNTPTGSVFSSNRDLTEVMRKYTKQELPDRSVAWNDALTQLGKEGWELVSTSIYGPADTPFREWWFKRPAP